MSSPNKRNKYNVDEMLDTPFNMKHFKRSFKYIKKYRRILFKAFGCSFISALLYMLVPLYIRFATDNLIENKNIPGLIILFLCFTLTVFLIILFNRKKGILSNVAGQEIIADIRSDLFEHLQDLPFEYYDTRPHGKILVRVVNYVNAVSEFFTFGLITMVLNMFNIVLILIFMLLTSAKLTLVILAGIPVFVTIVFIFKKAQRIAYQTLSAKQSNLNAYFSESINGIKVIQAFSREKFNLDICEDLSKQSKKAYMRTVILSMTIGSITPVLSTMATAAIYFCGIYFFPAITLGTLLAMAAYSKSFWQPIQSLADVYNQFINTISYLERIFEAIDEPVKILDCENAIEPSEFNGDVEFVNVNFEYDKGVKILENVSFKVPAGSSIALVGPTGAGKTTIVNLISRFYDVTDGKILIDGRDIRDYCQDFLHRKTGVMLQDTFIFSGTIFDNIKYGRLDSSDEEVINAAKTVMAHDFIVKMPQGYDTVVSERGLSLSAGQRQLISFARTLLSDPKILILDEATSAIDTITEKLIQKGLQNLIKGRTSLIIAHRLSTIKHCDEIYYINSKTISEKGSHKELMKKKGLYYNLYTSQIY